MSRLCISHGTVYRYRAPVRFGPHRLVLRPREGHDVDVVAMAIETEPAASITWSRDVFGNSIATLTFAEAASLLRIQSDVLLDRSRAADAPHDRVRPTEYPVAYDPLESALTAAYLTLSHAEDAPAMRSFLDAVGAPARGDAASALERLNREIHSRIGYRRREQKGTQTPATTIALGTGSCRDKATLFMDCARMLGIAARFASGYLDCAASEAGRAATHAWAEVYLPQNGWCGFDPTLGETTSHKHVVVGVSNHPRGVMPISGHFTGDPADYLGLEVSVQIRKTAPDATLARPNVDAAFESAPLAHAAVIP